MEAASEWVQLADAAERLGVSGSGLRKRLNRQLSDLVDGEDFRKISGLDDGGPARWVLHQSLVERWKSSAPEETVSERGSELWLANEKIDLLHAELNAERAARSDATARASEAEMTLLRTERDSAIKQRDVARAELLTLFGSYERFLRDV